jgi:hypothetical protein
LTATNYVTFPLQFIPRYGEAMKLAIEMHAVLVALEEAHFQMTKLQSEVAQNAAELQQAVARYSGVADSAELPDAAGHSGQPPPPSSGARLPAAEPSVVPQQKVAPSTVPRLPAPAGGVENTPPPLPQVPPMSSSGALTTGVAPAPAPLAAPPAPRSNKKARHREDEGPKAPPCGGEAGRVPLAVRGKPDPADHRGPVAASSEPSNPPGPPAGTPPQGQR